MRLTTIGCILIVLFPLGIWAEESEIGWEVEERCAPIVNPPDDWQFGGTVIADGWAGLHGMNAQLTTPYVLAWDSGWLTTFSDGALSPDGRWYVRPHGISYIVDNQVHYFSTRYMTVTGLGLYDLANPSNHAILAWNYHYQSELGTGTGRWSYPFVFNAPVWLGNETILYGSGNANPQSFSPEFFNAVHIHDRTVEKLEDTQYDEEINPTQVLSVFPARDGSRLVIFDAMNLSLVDWVTMDRVTDLYPENHDLNYNDFFVAWHPESTEFIISGNDGIFIYDRDGNRLDTISNQVSNLDLSHNKSAYSSDGSRMYFWVRDPSGVRKYVLANRANRLLIDTCLTFSSAVFSPDGRYMAGLLDVDKAQDELHIFDIERWEVYPTGIYQQGAVMGWGDW